MTAFAALPADRYEVIYADPPWQIRGQLRDSRRGKSVADHYSVVPMRDLARLGVADIAADDCLLFLWVIQSELDQCMDVARQWGFSYTTVAYVWHKQRQNLGYYTHPSIEICLLWSKGRPTRLRRGSYIERQFVSTPRTKHSRKPAAVRQSIERLYPTCSRIELFARDAHAGWAAWGDEVNVPATELSWQQMVLL